MAFGALVWLSVTSTGCISGGRGESGYEVVERSKGVAPAWVEATSSVQPNKTHLHFVHSKADVQSLQLGIKQAQLGAGAAFGRALHQQLVKLFGEIQQEGKGQGQSVSPPADLNRWFAKESGRLAGELAVIKDIYFEKRERLKSSLEPSAPDSGYWIFILMTLDAQAFSQGLLKAAASETSFSPQIRSSIKALTQALVEKGR